MITYSLLTRKGDHEPNEDMVGMTEADGKYCFVVADGLGGHGKGEAASRLVTEEVTGLFMTDCHRQDFIEKAFEMSQQKLCSEQERERAVYGMKTTMVLLTVDDKQMEYGHIGDTRLYYFRKNKLVTRTLDHSVPQMLVAAGRIKEKEIRHHPDRNRLLRVMGAKWDGTPYEVHKPIKRENRKRQAFLMCTDGFWELIDEKTMVNLLKQADDPEQWLISMEKEILKNGKDLEMDNYSAIAVFVK